ncbi:MAG TPA: helix-turn-helix transcriptional regulator [Polyangia bacterium]
MRAILQELIYDALVDGAVWPFDRHYIRPPHFHGQIELLLIREGTATLHLGLRSETVRAGQLAWVLPGIPHVMSDFSSDFDMWVVELDAALVATCWRALGNDAPQPGAFGCLAALGERLAGRATVELSAQEAADLDALARDVWSAEAPRTARTGLRAFGALALRSTLPNIDERRPGSPALMASCLLLASPTMDRPALAAALGVSEGFLSRSFSRELGVTFVEHRARTRVTHFLALAQQERANLLEAALAAGFGSYSQFHRSFARVSGSGPRDYLDAGRHRQQLLVAGDLREPHRAPARERLTRQRAPMDSREHAPPSS